MNLFKKTIGIILCLVISAAMPVTASALTTSGVTGDCEWHYDIDTATLTISGEGKTAEYSLFDWSGINKSVKTLIIEDGVTAIGNSFFEEFEALKDVHIADSVAEMGMYAFSACASLESIDLPDKLETIPDGAFCSCDKLTDVAIPESVDYIGQCAFYGCTSLKSIDIPDGVTNIGSEAFRDCTSLESFRMPEKLNSIDYGLLYCCTGLKSIFISKSVKWGVDDYNFDGTDSLEEITVDPKNTEYRSEDGVLYTKDLKKLLVYPSGKKDTEFKMPEGVTFLPSHSFNNCLFETVITSDSLKSIGENAFYKCENLKKIKLGSGAKKLYGSPCYECPKFEKFTVSSKNKYFSSVDGVLFSKNKTSLIMCPKATAFKIPSTVKSIEASAFENTELESINIPKSVEKIGAYAFSNCQKIQSVKFSKGLKTIGEGAFSGCKNIPSVTIPDSVTKIGTSAFDDCTGIKSLKLGRSVKSIGRMAFFYCRRIKSLSFPDSLTTIGESAFAHCHKLKTVKCGKGLRSIDGLAFDVCTELKTVKFNSGLTEVGGSAFYTCSKLKKIRLPKSLKKIGIEAFGYSYDERGDEFPSEKIAGVVIYGHKGSTAEKYAKKNKFKFKAV